MSPSILKDGSVDLYELGRTTVGRGLRLTAADYAIVRGQSHEYRRGAAGC